jgi:hypothetical protein
MDIKDGPTRRCRCTAHPVGWVFAVVLCLFVLSDADAQSRNELGTWAGFSAGTPTLIGKTRDVSYALFGVRYSRTLLQRSGFDLQYTADVTPLARLRYLDNEVGYRQATGWGAAPLGLEIRLRPGKRVEPAVTSNFGFIRFNRDVPSGGRRFNFSADLGGALRFHLNRSVTVMAGYRYHHLSNGYTTTVNPGFDSNLITVGVRFPR